MIKLLRRNYESLALPTELRRRELSLQAASADFIFQKSLAPPTRIPCSCLYISIFVKTPTAKDEGFDKIWEFFDSPSFLELVERQQQKRENHTIEADAEELALE